MPLFVSGSLTVDNPERRGLDFVILDCQWSACGILVFLV